LFLIPVTQILLSYFTSKLHHPLTAHTDTSTHPALRANAPNLLLLPHIFIINTVVISQYLIFDSL
ncbi:hypothetical protein MEN41_19245, partial [Dolichospermum sp. ST_con]|nr:hypothetical protein [Dolichospermum sp. ST_con]